MNLDKMLQRFGQGDLEAFEALYTLYAPKMRLFATRLLHDSLLAEDVTHTVFLRLWNDREVVSKVDSFDAYAFRSVRNAIFDIYEHRIIVANFNNKLRNSAVEQIYDQEEQIAADDLQLMIELAIDKMSPQRRRIFCMSRFEGLSNTEIAERLNISINTVNNTISTAIHELRDALAAYNI